GLDVPERLPPEGEAVLRGLQWQGHSRGKMPPEEWFTTLRDAARDGAVRDEVRSAVSALAERARVCV
ncbi:MAG: acetoin utilization protein AcuC, partial [Pseudomonadota bacterium]